MINRPASIFKAVQQKTIKLHKSLMDYDTAHIHPG
ncbi:hypothetical protein BVRB_6g148270 [Beta vulgaris subsp. vulgaris]|nr:hypothetical protein BVRB_6g148270 [Beta vulgaris subsp. vulgaris]